MSATTQDVQITLYVPLQFIMLSCRFFHVIFTSTAPPHSWQGKFYHLHFTDEKSKPQGKECSHKTNKQQRAGEEQEWSPHELATINSAPSDDGPPPPRPNPAPRGTVCSKGTAVSPRNVTHHSREKQIRGLSRHQHPALRNQLTCLYMKLYWQMQGECSSKWSQRMLTSIVPVANKPCTEFMSQTLFSLKQWSGKRESFSICFRWRDTQKPS